MSFLSYLITGISLGSIYAIIALGYTMVYGIAKMLNFAHGDVIMVGAYVSFYVTMFAGSNLLGDDPSTLASGIVALVSVLLAMAAPPVPGGSLTCYTVLLTQLGIPEEAIGLAIAGNVILGFFMTACGVSCLQSELVLVANKLGMLDRDCLARREAKGQPAADTH